MHIKVMRGFIIGQTADPIIKRLCLFSNFNFSSPCFLFKRLLIIRANLSGAESRDYYFYMNEPYCKRNPTTDINL